MKYEHLDPFGLRKPITDCCSDLISRPWQRLHGDFRVKGRMELWKAARITPVVVPHLHGISPRDLPEPLRLLLPAVRAQAGAS